MGQSSRLFTYSNRKLIVAVGFLGAALGIFVGFEWYRGWQLGLEKENALADLQAVLAEIERAAPGGWNLATLEAERAPIAEKEHAAATAQRAWNLLPQGWEENPDLPEVEPGALLSVVGNNHSIALRDEDAEKIKRELAKVTAAVDEARKLLAFKAGRFPTTAMRPDQLLSDSPPHVKKLLGLARLLTYEAIAKSHDREIDSAWLAALTILNVGRAVGDEPGLHAQLLRVTSPARAGVVIQRILGQGEVNDGLLEKAIRLFNEELADKPEERWIRGERARQHHFYVNLANGQLDPTELWSDFRWPEGHDDPNRRLPMIHRSHAYTLRFLTRALEVIQKGPAECRRCMQDLDLEHKHGLGIGTVPALAQFLTPAVWKVVNATERTKLSCLIAGLAAERFRLKHGQWPEKADELITAGFLTVIPHDYDLDKPVQFRRTKDGVVFYSPGYVQYEGDALDEVEPGYRSHYTPPEFRVWSPEHRHRAPPAPKFD
jgi:hypothetical protein